MTAPAPGRATGDAGASMAEVLVALLLVGLLTAVAGTVLVSTAKSTQAGRGRVDATEEARLALNRMTRELREARAITAVHPAGSGTQGLTLEVDLNGDGSITPGGTEPERLTYCFVGSQVLLSAGPASCTTSGLPVVSGQVTAFALEYSSSYAANGRGPLTWQQLDAAGNKNGLDGGELPLLDTVGIRLEVQPPGGTPEVFRSTVELRNH